MPKKNVNNGKNKKKQKRVISKFLSIFMMVALALLIFQIVNLNLLPLKFMVLVSLVLIILALIGLILLNYKSKKVF